MHWYFYEIVRHIDCLVAKAILLRAEAQGEFFINGQITQFCGLSLQGSCCNFIITLSNMSLLKTGKVRGIRFNTLEAICRTLDCQPGDILEYEPDDDDLRSNDSTEQNDRTA